MEKISLIIPCYNEEESLPPLYAELKRVKAEMSEYTFEMLFVDDGSKDKTLPILKEMAKEDDRVKYISFSRNFGKEAAMYAGFCNVTGDYAAVMDADMQDPPALLPKMMEIIKGGEYDSVATRRVTRKGEPKIRSFFANTFYKMMKKISDAVESYKDLIFEVERFIWEHPETGYKEWVTSKYLAEQFTLNANRTDVIGLRK